MDQHSISLDRFSLRPRIPVVLITTVLALAACTAESGDASELEGVDSATAMNTSRTDTTDCEPLETRPPEAPDQQPAFEGQTRACGVSADVDLEVVVLADGLEHPWAVEPLPDGSFLVTRSEEHTSELQSRENLVCRL